MTTTMDKVITCRLCFDSNHSLLNIFNETDLNGVQIAKILAEHIGEVNQTDPLPNFVCSMCWEKTENFHTFHRSVRVAQENFLHRFVKNEVKNDAEELMNVDIAPAAVVEPICNDNKIEPSTEEQADSYDLSDDGADFGGFPNLEENLQNDWKDSSDESNTEKNAQQSEPESSNVNIARAVGFRVDPDTAKRLFDEHFDTTCDFCRTELKTLDKAKEHYKTVHNSRYAYVKCCGLKITREELIIDHIRYHINPDIFKCIHCDNVSKTRASMKSHLYRHKNDKIFTCDICQRNFKTFTSMKKHMGVHIRNAKSVGCEYCSKKFPTQDKLDEHLTIRHTAGKAQIQLSQLRKVKVMDLKSVDIERVMSQYFDMGCDHCGHLFKTLSEAQNHYSNKHNIPNGYVKCCRHIFKNDYTINGHILWHLKPELFRCSICSKYLDTMIALKAHLIMHGELKAPRKRVQISHACPECNKKFSAETDLIRHLKYAHDSVLPPELCEYCGETFVTKTKAQAHVRSIHTEETAMRRQ